MKFARIAIFTLLLNFSIGMTILMYPGMFDNPEQRGGLESDTKYATVFLEEANGTINPTKDLENEATATDRILDKLALGVLIKFLSGINNILYGIVNMVGLVFGPIFGTNQALLTMIKTSLTLVITLSYIAGAIDLWTGKNIQN